MKELITDGEYLVDEKRAAKFLGFTPRFLQVRRARGGGLPYVKVCRSVRYRVSDLVGWIEARVKENTSQQ